MKTNYNKPRACLFVAILLIIFAQSVYGQEPNRQQPTNHYLTKQLQKTVADTAFTDTPMWNALATVATTHQVIIGFEFKQPVNGLSRADHITVKLSKGTLMDLLNTVVGSDPTYTWVKSDGVINVLPKETQNPILETVLTEFQVDQATAYEASQAITTTPEVVAVMERLGMTRHDLLNITGTGEYLRGKRITLALHNVTVRQILNEIIKASGRHSWVFSVYGDHNQYFTIGV